MSDEAWFDSARFEELRTGAGVTWGRPVRVHDRVESTNDLGLTAVASDALTGIAWVAREQTRGRGRRGNAWVARPGDALLMSTLLRWPAPIQTATGLGLAAGLAVLGACQLRVPVDLSLKWPNDVVAGDAKLAGILIETKPDGKGGTGVVLGVGVNVGARSFEEAAGNATSLALLGVDESDLGLESLLADVLLGLEHLVPRILSGRMNEVIAEVRTVDALSGRRVRVVEAGGDALDGAEGNVVTGVARGITYAGELEVETASGIARIMTGHVIVE